MCGGVCGGVCDGRRWGSGWVGEFKCILVHFEPEISIKKKIKKCIPYGILLLQQYYIKHEAKVGLTLTLVPNTKKVQKNAY